MSEQPIEPRNIAAAIVELAHPLLLRAWQLTLDEHALTTVPGDIRRQGLRVPHDSRDLAPVEARDTEALGLVIVSGTVARSDCMHATVWRGDELVHDPHPSRAGLVKIEDTLAFVPELSRSCV